MFREVRDIAQEGFARQTDDITQSIFMDVVFCPSRSRKGFRKPHGELNPKRLVRKDSSLKSHLYKTGTGAAVFSLTRTRPQGRQVWAEPRSELAVDQLAQGVRRACMYSRGDQA